MVINELRNFVCELLLEIYGEEKCETEREEPFNLIKD